MRSSFTSLRFLERATARSEPEFQCSLSSSRGELVWPRAIFSGSIRDDSPCLKTFFDAKHRATVACPPTSSCAKITRQTRSAKILVGKKKRHSELDRTRIYAATPGRYPT